MKVKIQYYWYSLFSECFSDRIDYFAAARNLSCLSCLVACQTSKSVVLGHNLLLYICVLNLRYLNFIIGDIWMFVMFTDHVGTQRNYKESTPMAIFLSNLPNALAFWKVLCYAAFSETLICLWLFVNAFYFGWCQCFGVFNAKYEIIPFVHISVHLMFSNLWRRCLLLSETLLEN